MPYDIVKTKYSLKPLRTTIKMIEHSVSLKRLAILEGIVVLLSYFLESPFPFLREIAVSYIGDFPFNTFRGRNEIILIIRVLMHEPIMIRPTY